jgi:hypothetical protein
MRTPLTVVVMLAALVAAGPACRRLYDDPRAVKAVEAPPGERGVKLGDLLQ